MDPAALPEPICPPWRLVRKRLDELKLPEDAPRQDVGDISELSSSIAEHGLLVPLLVEPDGTVRAGTRRLAAMRRLGIEEAECLIVPPGSDGPIVQLVENLHRKALDPLEEARAFRAILDRTGWSQAALARRLGVSPAKVCLALKLLEAPPELKEKLEAGELGSYAVATAAGRRERVERRLREGKVLAADFLPLSVRVPKRLLPPGVRARVFADRIEITFTVWTGSEASPPKLVEAFRAALGDELAFRRALEEARSKLAELSTTT